MLTLIVLLVLASTSFLAISLKKSYAQISTKELKRRARSGDTLAKLLHRAAAFGTSLTILLWLVIGLSSGGFFILLARSLPAWAAFLISLAVIWFGFAWLPNTRASAMSKYYVRWFTPAITWLLIRFRPLLGRAELFFHDHAHIHLHTGLYEKEDLLELLRNQKKQLDNRITKNELKIAAGAIEFSDKTVRDVMTPRRMVKMVSANDFIGPVLMNELHDSGHSRFPVYGGKQGNIVGVLYLRDLLEIKDKRKVSELMKSQVYYVNEELKLGHVLQAILKTKHHMFVAVDSFEEVVGVITIEDILEQIIGQPIIDEFDKYENLRAVAKLTASEEKAEHQEVSEK